MELTVLIPASYTSETGDAKLGTYKIGQIARAAAVFGCDRVVVYDDDPSDEAIPLVLRYAVTPPYLRKELFERREELRYAGAVPPLRIPPHTVSDREGSETQQEYRQGVVTDVASDGRVWVDCGTQHPVALRVPDHIREGIREGKRVTLRISSREPLRAEVVSPDNVPLYWGYEVVEASLVEWLDGFVDDGGVAVSTSRKGRRVEEDDLTHE
ncbi:MAG: RNA methyltransferase, partial [Halobacteria archaeon]|nr:RNA methyltransferase [Halobacteria archaeon]